MNTLAILVDRLVLLIDQLSSTSTVDTPAILVEEGGWKVLGHDCWCCTVS